MNQIRMMIVSLQQFLTIATLYMASDALYDWGLLSLPQFYADLLYFGRYALVIIWYSIKFVRKRLESTQKDHLKYPKNVKRR
jgi:hypothetical protein